MNLQEQYRKKPRYLAEWSGQTDLHFDAWRDGWTECEALYRGLLKDREYLEGCLADLDAEDVQQEQENLRRGLV